MTVAHLKAIEPYPHTGNPEKQGNSSWPEEFPLPGKKLQIIIAATNFTLTYVFCRLQNATFLWACLTLLFPKNWKNTGMVTSPALGTDTEEKVEKVRQFEASTTSCSGLLSYHNIH